ncbi:MULTISPECIES: glycosyltransferase family 2 protein [unclassified Roseateles]|uniref:glycosyltransferase family 2 protein n=1 Tax=unclassified Roseateles TaxID=2626991 RepID=UPI0006FE144F|nr:MULTISPECIES: glycosyltransferase family A protein [unclassified Roseateles]KQW43254.1 glycosyl transferase family 2 [Pelomonas sp. Root405]KRA70992.1 glycosyl transferase family 2 [Pelomonas sp. Root662]
MTTAPRISVVLPTFHRPDLLARCLHALLAQTLPAGRFEIIVVDDGHDDATREQVHGMAATAAVSIRYLRPPTGRGPAVARNAGWRAARGDWVAFTDDDTRPDADWLKEGLATLALHPDWVAAAGQVRVPRDGDDSRRPTDHELMTRGLETAEFVTANAFVRRDVLDRIGGFDERFLRAWREDSDLHFRLLQAGPIGRAPRAVVTHPVRPERWGVSLRQQRNVFFDALLYRKHPRPYRSRVRPVPPWDYYAIVALTLAVPLLALAGQTRASALALAAALLLILAVAWRRLRPTSRAPGHVLEMLATSAAIPFLSVYWRLRGAWHFRTPFL